VWISRGRELFDSRAKERRATPIVDCDCQKRKSSEQNSELPLETRGIRSPRCYNLIILLQLILNLDECILIAFD